MPIYSGQGDAGRTRRMGGREVPKCDPSVRATGVLDELGARLGWCLAAAAGAADVAEPLRRIQSELLAAGAMLAAAGADVRPGAALADEAVAWIEATIDAAEAELPALDRLLVPVGCELACRLHLARTACRRAECDVAALAADVTVPAAVPRYLNRLSDLLFVLARLANVRAGVAEQRWEPPA